MHACGSVFACASDICTLYYMRLSENWELGENRIYKESREKSLSLWSIIFFTFCACVLLRHCPYGVWGQCVYAVCLTRAASASTVHAFNNLPLFQLALGHAANAVGTKVRLTHLNATQTTQVLVALLLPLRDEIPIGVSFSQAELVEFFTNGAPLIVKVIHIARLLVVYLEDGP